MTTCSDHDIWQIANPNDNDSPTHCIRIVILRFTGAVLAIRIMILQPPFFPLLFWLWFLYCFLYLIIYFFIHNKTISTGIMSHKWNKLHMFPFDTDYDITNKQEAVFYWFFVYIFFIYLFQVYMFLSFI